MANVTIYTSSSCPHCVTTKNYFSSKGINYIEKNVSQDSNAKRELMALGYRSVPIIVINGTKVVGFNKRKIEKLI